MSSSRHPPVPSTLSSSLISCSFDIRDTNKIWTPATIQRIDIENSRVLVHYQDWPSRWDEYISFPSNRIARYLSKRPNDAYGRPRQRNIATLTNLKYGYHRHQAIKALEKVGDIDPNGQRNFMAALQWLQNNVEVPDDEEDEVYMDDYVLPSDVEYQTEDEQEQEQEQEQTQSQTNTTDSTTATVTNTETCTVVEKPVVAVAVAVAARDIAIATAVAALTIETTSPASIEPANTSTPSLPTVASSDVGASLATVSSSVPLPPTIPITPTPCTPTSPSMGLLQPDTNTDTHTLSASCNAAAGVAVTAVVGSVAQRVQ